MQRIAGDTVQADKFGAGKPGFSEGNAETQRPATIVTGTWLDAVQEEIVRAIEASGQTPDPTNLSQLAQAIAQAAASGPVSAPGVDPTTLLSRINEWTGGTMPNDIGNTFKTRVLFDGPVVVRGTDPNAPSYFRGDTFRFHKKLLPLTAIHGVLPGGQVDVQDQGFRMYNAIGQTYQGVAKLDLNAFIPRGATLSELKCGVYTSQGSGGAGRMVMRMQRFTPVMTGDGGPNAQQTLFTRTASKGGEAIITSPAMSVVVTDSLPLRLEWTGSAAAQYTDPDYVHWIQATYAGWFGDEYD